jgi:hypothetical protein
MPIVIRTACAVLIAFLAAGVGAAAQMSVKGPVTFFDFTFPEEIAGARASMFTITRQPNRDWVIARAIGKER